MKPTASPLSRPWPYVLLALIVLASAAGNLYWLQQNTVQLGHDASAHLSRTLKMAEAMTPFSLGSFLRGLTLTEFRPPGLYLLAQPFYALFGRAIDTAQLANVLTQALILLCTFLLAQRVLRGAPGASSLALLATAITALLPMLLAMSRLFYTETLVTLGVAAGVLCLLASAGYTRRSWCLALGAALGVGMLAKWTLPVYLGAPLLVAAWQSPLREIVRTRDWRALVLPCKPGEPSSAWRWSNVLVRGAPAAVGAAVGAAAVALLLYWPQQELWAQTPLGPWLAAAWFATWFALFSLLLAPSTPLFNLLLALAVGAAIGGLWYLPRAGFAAELSDVAFGTGSGDYAAADWTSFNQYFRYFRLFYQHHLGLLLALLILPAGLLPWLWRGRAWLRSLPGALLLWAATLSPFLLLIVTSQTNSRNLVPVLPLFAILVTVGLLAYRPPWRMGIAAAWLAALLLFWAFATFDGPAALRAQTSFLWPGQGYSAAPASGETDPGYWIVPDVLATITAISSDSALAVQAGAPQTTTLGVLVDTASVHAGSFEYDILLRQEPVDLNSLTGPEVRGARDAVANQWLLFKNGDNRELAAAAQELAGQLLARAPWLDRLYTPVKSYRLPSGDTAWLYRRSAGPADPYLFSTIVGEDLPPVAEAVRRWWSADATLAVATPETAVWLATQDAPLDSAVIPPDGRNLELRDLAGVQRTLIVVSRYHTPEFQTWLGQEHRYITEAAGGEFTATLYGRVDSPLVEADPNDLAGAAWEPLRVTALATWPQVAPGDPLPVDVTLAGELDGSWKVSARLVDEAGSIIWQQDTEARGGTLPLTLFVPPSALPGEYSLQLVVYNAATQEAVTDLAGRPAAPLATIEVLESS